MKLIKLLPLMLLIALINYAQGSDRHSFTLAASVYVGWMPWYLAHEDGTLAAVSDKYNLQIDFAPADYVDSINLYAGGGADAVVLTNIDMVGLLANSNVPSDIILVGSYSNGNDALLTRQEVANLPDQGSIGLVQYSVSHYLFDRYFEIKGIDPLAQQGRLLNLPDSELGAAFARGGAGLSAVVSWNPIVLQLQRDFGAYKLFDSYAIPTEIADLLLLRRSALLANPDFAQALLEVWFGITARISDGSPERERTYAQLGFLSGSDAEEYQQQLSTTVLFTDTRTALQALQAPGRASNYQRVVDFVTRHQLLELGTKPQQLLALEADSDALLRYNSNPLEGYIEQGK